MKSLFTILTILTSNLSVATPTFPQYIGCFVCVGRSSGSFQHLSNKLNNNVIRLSDCLQSCALTGKILAAISYGRYCSCISKKTLDNCLTVKDVECSSQCVNKERCGSKERYSIYKLLLDKFDWGEWNVWEGCSVDCGGGTEIRRKSCRNPDKCSGKELTEVRECNTFFCQASEIINNKGARKKTEKYLNVWSKWSSWSVCSQSCNGSERIRKRHCYRPPCRGFQTVVRICSRVKCRPELGWSQWTAWSNCSSNSDVESSKRHRQCNLPKYIDSRKVCMGTIEEYKQCFKTKNCPINSSFIRGHDSIKTLQSNKRDLIHVDLHATHKSLMNKKMLDLIAYLLFIAILFICSFFVLFSYAKRFFCIINRSSEEGKNLKPNKSDYRENPENRERLFANEEILKQKLATIAETTDEESSNSKSALNVNQQSSRPNSSLPPLQGQYSMYLDPNVERNPQENCCEIDIQTVSDRLFRSTQLTDKSSGKCSSLRTDSSLELSCDKYINEAESPLKYHQLNNQLKEEKLKSIKQSRSKELYAKRAFAEETDLDYIKDEYEPYSANFSRRDGPFLNRLFASEQDAEGENQSSLLCPSNPELDQTNFNRKASAQQHESPAYNNPPQTQIYIKNDQLKDSQLNFAKKYSGIYPGLPKLINLDFTNDKQIGNKSKTAKIDSKIVGLEAQKKPSKENLEKCTRRNLIDSSKEITIPHLSCDWNRKLSISDSRNEFFVNQRPGFKLIESRIKSTGRTLKINDTKTRNRMTISTQTKRKHWLEEGSMNQVSSISNRGIENQLSVDTTPDSWDNKSLNRVKVIPVANGPLHHLNFEIPEHQSSTDLALTETCKNLQSLTELLEKEISLNRLKERCDLSTISREHLETMKAKKVQEENGRIQDFIEEKNSISIDLKRELSAFR
ncbi:DgyrCDS8810 [Dimorphilus gyrociliatus]|uniref:DgyrCDS8810 n=1 Tax=Dimorphilus gyrociliatus TaxID=2664684 RepID=A0A7I8VWC8_9ANNE|nr:DgyrCDS8810 [Dimorphilus gyrociliatus]